MHYFPTTPGKIIRIAAPNAPARNGWLIREATPDEQAQIEDGENYWTPTGEGTGTLSAPPVSRHKVQKDTLIQRIAEAGKVAEAAALYASQSDADKFVWDGSAWFWDDNPAIIAMAQALGLDPDVVLAK